MELSGHRWKVLMPIALDIEPQLVSLKNFSDMCTTTNQEVPIFFGFKLYFMSSIMADENQAVK